MLCGTCRDPIKVILKYPPGHTVDCSVSLQQVIENSLTCIACYKTLHRLLEISEIQVARRTFTPSWVPSKDVAFCRQLQAWMADDQVAISYSRSRVRNDSGRNFIDAWVKTGLRIARVSFILERLSLRRALTECASRQDHRSSMVSPGYSLDRAQLNNIRDWLQTCTLSHEKCKLAPCRRAKSPQASFVPTRLVEIGTRKTQLRLVVTAKEQNVGSCRYATLSHCWGKVPFNTLTAQNEGELRLKIEPSFLTKTFSEAVILCRLLRIRYLWIDSLCILQDDPDDLSNELGMMEMIYSRSHVHLAAAASGNGEQGLFRPINRVAVASARLGLKTRVRPGHEIHMRALTVSSPLLRRGWVLQEIALSARTIYFTDTTMILHCFTDQLLLGPQGLESASLLKPKLDWSSLGSVQSIEKAWMDVATEYGPTRVRFPRDRAIAIAGLAARFGREYYRIEGFAAQYIIGCWRHNAHIWLLWLFDPYDKLPDNARRKDGLVAPTWSWLSAQKAVVFAIDPVANVEVLRTVTVENVELKLHNALIPTGPASMGRLLLRASWMQHTVGTLDEFQMPVWWDDVSTGGTVGQRVLLLFIACTPYAPSISRTRGLVCSMLGGGDGTPLRVRRQGYFRYDLDDDRIDEFYLATLETGLIWLE